MTLNKTDTCGLQLLLIGDSRFAYWLKHKSAISSNEYSALQGENDAQEAAYNETPSNLYGTNPNDTTFQFSGIGSFPKLP